MLQRAARELSLEDRLAAVGGQLRDLRLQTLGGRTDPRVAVADCDGVRIIMPLHNLRAASPRSWTSSVGNTKSRTSSPRLFSRSVMFPVVTHRAGPRQPVRLSNYAQNSQNNRSPSVAISERRNRHPLGDRDAHPDSDTMTPMMLWPGSSARYIYVHKELQI